MSIENPSEKSGQEEGEFREERDSEYAEHKMEEEREEEWKQALPDDADELFRMRAETTSKSDEAYDEGDKKEGRRLANRVQTINHKLNEIGAEEPGS